MVIEDDLEADLPGVGDDLLENLESVKTCQIRVLRVVDGVRHCEQADIRPGNADRVKPIGFDAVHDGLVAGGVKPLERAPCQAVGASPAG